MAYVKFMAHALKDSPKSGVKIVDEKQRTTDMPSTSTDGIVLKPNFRSIIVRPVFFHYHLYSLINNKLITRKTKLWAYQEQAIHHLILLSQLQLL